MKRLFMVVDGVDNPCFEKKQDAKKKRDDLLVSNPRGNFHVTYGPDHHRYRGVTPTLARALKKGKPKQQTMAEFYSQEYPLGYDLIRGEEA
jgi:hypothetical protein